MTTARAPEADEAEARRPVEQGRRRHRASLAHALRKVVSSWVLVVAGCFAVVYAASLTYVYVEGNDATSILYHSLGRDQEVQRSHNAYQVGADVLLSVLPADERIVRITAISLSALAAVVMAVLMLALAFDWLGETARVSRPVAAVAVLLALPELFYLGLLYTPAVIGMLFVVAGHLVLRAVARQDWSSSGALGSLPKVALAAGLFGLGAACRWNLLSYGAVVALDLLINRTSGGARRRRVPDTFALLALFAALAGVAWSVVVLAGGYRLTDVFGAITETGEVAAKSRDYVLWLGNNVALFTPATLILGGWGYLALPPRLRWFVTFNLAGMAVAAAVLGWSWPKLLIGFLPAVVLCVVNGLSARWSRSSRLRPPPPAVVALILVLPWLVGVRLTYQDTAWGPGFQLAPFDRERREPTIKAALGRARPSRRQRGRGLC